MANAAAGWYADPHKNHKHRYWTGKGWTDYVADGQSVITDQMDPQGPRLLASPPAPPTLKVASEGHAPNPIGLAVVLLGALGTVIALFLPEVESHTFAGVVDNTLISKSWWLIIPAV